MTVALDPVNAAATPSAPPTQYVVPRMHGDPAAARRLAASYRATADEVATASRLVAAVVSDLGSSWTGAGHHASAHPAGVVHRNAATTTRALHEAADALDVYAHKLETAHHSHGFSLHKLLAVAAVVTVTATAVVVTMGAAAAAEAALAASAAGEATAAAGSAVAASQGAAAGLLESTISLAGVRALVSYVAPHLVQAELAAGFAATVEEGADGELDWHEIGVAAGAGFAGSAGAARAGRVYRSVKFAKKAWPLLHLLVPHLAQGAAFAGADAAEQAASGAGVFSVREMLLAGGAAAAGVLAPARAAGPLVAHALARQTPGEMLADGVDLVRHEAPGLGHTLAKHVLVDDDALRARVAAEGRRAASRFSDLQTAQRAVTELLRRDAAALRAFADGSTTSTRIRGTLDHVVGVVVRADGSATPTRRLVVWLRKDGRGVYISSAYPELPQ